MSESGAPKLFEVFSESNLPASRRPPKPDPLLDALAALESGKAAKVPVPEGETQANFASRVRNGLNSRKVKPSVVRDSNEGFIWVRIRRDT